MNEFKVIDLFCGAGGLTKGFHEAGFKTLYAVEYNKTFAKTYNLNFPNVNLHVGDIKDISNNEIEYLKSVYKIDIIIGGPPCQGFSVAGNIGRMFLNDPRNKLFIEYFRFVKIFKPKMFIIENVAILVTHNKGKTIKEIVDMFSDIGYKIKYQILNSVNYDVPQERRRVFIVGTSEKLEFQYPIAKSNVLTISDAIGNLPPIESGQQSEVDLHFAMNHTKQMLKKMSYVQDGGDRYDIPLELRPTSGDIRKYIKYNSKKPAVCVTGDMRKIFHYSQNRALTCRELARLQTFDDTFKFMGNSIQVQQQIGNAVPCKLAYAVAIECMRCLKNE